MNTETTTSVRVEMVEGASRCRRLNTNGRQCGSYTKRVVVVEQADREDRRTADCGKHRP